jgi:hypothetical protein
MAKPDIATEPQRETRKRKQQADDDDEPSSPQPSKKIRSDDAAESEPDENDAADSGVRDFSSGTQNDGETGRRPARGRPEQNHDGKKCCNTCQAWKHKSEFGPKKHSKIEGAQVGYCLRCQASKQAKNKAKADAKKEIAQKSTETISAEIDDNAEGESNGDDHDLNENATLDEVAVDAQG